MLERDPTRTAEFLHQFKADVDIKKTWMMWDREAYDAFLRSAPATVAAEFKRLADAGEAAASEGSS